MIFQSFIALIEAQSVGPSKILPSSTQAYSAPERLTPSRRTVFPDWSTSWLPLTPIQGAADAPETGSASSAKAAISHSRERRGVDTVSN